MACAALKFFRTERKAPGESGLRGFPTKWTGEDQPAGARFESKFEMSEICNDQKRKVVTWQAPV